MSGNDSGHLHGRPYPLEYYFELQGLPSGPALFPGFDVVQTNQPYFVMRRARAE